jgi:hypothetical protein
VRENGSGVRCATDDGWVQFAAHRNRLLEVGAGVRKGDAERRDEVRRG